MELNKVMFGLDYLYYDRHHKSLCHVVATDHDDGASLIIELHANNEDDVLDITGNIRRSEACFLQLLNQ